MLFESPRLGRRARARRHRADDRPRHVRVPRDVGAPGAVLAPRSRARSRWSAAATCTRGRGAEAPGNRARVPPRARRRGGAGRRASTTTSPARRSPTHASKCGPATRSSRSRSSPGELDVIMVDLTDPIGPAARLFEDEFYALCERVAAARRLSSSRRRNRSTSTPTSSASCFDRARRAASRTPSCCGVRSRPTRARSGRSASRPRAPTRVVRRRPEWRHASTTSTRTNGSSFPKPVRRKLIGI